MSRINQLIVVVLLLSGCGSQGSQNEKDRIAVSILPQKYFVSKIAGDQFEINVLIPPGASPATYEPTPSQMASLSQTDLYMKLGHTGFEMAWMEKLASTNDQMKIIDLSEGVDLIIEDVLHEHTHEHDHHHGGVDPHIWLSPRNAMVIAKNISHALISEYPEFAESFSSNLALFLHELDTLDSYISKELSELTSNSFFIYHPSLSYYARDYDLKQYPMELGGKTPSASHMRNLIDTARKAGIRVIFLQMQFDEKNAEVLSKETGAEIIQINPLDVEWFDQMLYITKTLKENLQ